MIEDIEVIGRYTFSGTSIEEVYLHQSVERIDDYGFSDCKKLIRVVVKGIRKIENNAFLSCKKLQRVEFTSLNSCYDSSFEHCDNLLRENVIIPEEANVVEVVIKFCACGFSHKNIILSLLIK